MGNGFTLVKRARSLSEPFGLLHDGYSKTLFRTRPMGLRALGLGIPSKTLPHHFTNNSVLVKDLPDRL